MWAKKRRTIKGLEHLPPLTGKSFRGYTNLTRKLSYEEARLRNSSIDLDKFHWGNFNVYLRFSPIGRSVIKTMEFDDIEVAF